MLNAPANAPDWAHDFASAVQTELDLISRARGRMRAYAKANLPSAADAFSAVPRLGYSTMIFVTDESGGSVPAFTDGTNWRRVTDRAIVS